MSLEPGSLLPLPGSARGAEAFDGGALDEHGTFA